MWLLLLLGILLEQMPEFLHPLLLLLHLLLLHLLLLSLQLLSPLCLLLLLQLI